MGKNPVEFYFEVLNVPKDSSPQEIRSAYKALVKKWHPDKHPASSKPEAEAKFKAITQAYEALSDQEEGRATNTMFGVYSDVADAGGGSNKGAAARSSAWVGAASPGPNLRNRDFSPGTARSSPRTEFKDLYFGSAAAGAGAVSGAGAGAGARPAFSSYSASLRRKPPPIERKLECTLEDLYRGCKKEIKFTRDVVAKNGFITQKEEIQTIKVKPGWKKGTKITFEGMGDEKPGCLPADIVFMIAEKEHPVFKRVGNDLVLKVEVPLVNALTGWTFTFRLISGEKMTCSFDDEIIYPGYERVIKGHGMPVANEKGVRGDLRIKFHIVFPTLLSDEQRSSIVELLKDCT